MRCEAESTQVNLKKKKLSLYLLNTVTVVEMNFLLHLESICLSKQPPAPLTECTLHLLCPGHSSDSELRSFCSFHLRRAMSLLRKIAFSTLPSHLRKRGQLMQPSSMLSWLWLVAHLTTDFFSLCIL